MDGATIDGIHYKVEPSRNLSKQFSSAQFSQSTIPQSSASSGLFSQLRSDKPVAPRVAGGGNPSHSVMHHHHVQPTSLGLPAENVSFPSYSQHERDTHYLNRSHPPRSDYSAFGGLSDFSRTITPPGSLTSSNLAGMDDRHSLHTDSGSDHASEIFGNTRQSSPRDDCNGKGFISGSPSLAPSNPFGGLYSQPPSTLSENHLYSRHQMSFLHHF